MLAVIAAETSKVPFYVAGGVLAVFAVALSALGLARPDFPGTAATQRLTALIAIVLAAAAMAMAVVSA